MASPFDIFTGKPAIQAAGQQRAFLDRTQDQGRNDLSAGYNTGVGAVNTGANSARDALGIGYDTSRADVNAGATGAMGYLGQGANNALGYLGQAGNSFDALSALGTKYGAGTSTYLDSLGINGAEGNTRAQAAFQPSMAYNFNLDQGLDSISRLRNAQTGGNGMGGNTDRSAQEYGAGLASREFGGWQDRLAGLINPELAATSGAATGRAGVATNQANISNQLGQNQAGVDTGRAAMLSALAQQYGTGQAGSYTGQGNTLASLAQNEATNRVGLATNLAQPYANTYKQEADASLLGSKNMWGFGLAAAQLAAGMPPTSLGSLGGGGAPSGGAPSMGYTASSGLPIYGPGF